MADHLFHPGHREAHPIHVIPAQVTAILCADRLLRVSGPHAPTMVRRGLSSSETLHHWKGATARFTQSVPGVVLPIWGVPPHGPGSG